ncbi:MAG: hypothetical protein ACLUE1_04100 [Adlercreutzia equolifaciens]
MKANHLQPELITILDEGFSKDLEVAEDPGRMGRAESEGLPLHRHPEGRRGLRQRRHPQGEYNAFGDMRCPPSASAATRPADHPLKPTATTASTGHYGYARADRRAGGEGR